MPVRPLAENDIPQVADLYWKVLRERKSGVPPSVHSFLSELYFHNPWIDNSIPSLVYEEKGRIAGFLGVIPRRMCFRGEPIRIAYGGNFVVHPDFRNTLAGLHLLRTYMAGPQDLSQTDSANDTSRALLERLGFTTILPYSVHWVRLLRPARCAMFALTRLSRNGLAASLEFFSKPFCNLADAFVTKFSRSAFRPSESGLKAKDLSVEILLQCLREFRGGYSLWPEYDVASLQWLLDFMERMKGHGKSLRNLALHDESGNVVGWYIYYRNPGGFAQVVQVGGARKRVEQILDHLFYDAWNDGALALHGTVDRRLMGDFSQNDCFFTCRGGWTIAYSRKPQLLESLNNGEAFLSRLDGEWCFAFGG
jgi:hypothetical protein